MQYKITNEQPFQVLCSSFSISPSQQNYTLNISADGRNYSPLFTVASGQTRLVTGVASGSFYKLVGNQSEVTVNWVRSCSDGGSGGGNAGELEPVTEFPLGAQEGTVVALVSGNTAGVYQYDGEDWIPVGVDDLSNYYTKAETDVQITAATSPIEERIDDVERVTASALTELHQDILDLSAATPDMSDYYTKDEVDAEITGATDGFATEAYVDDAISGITDMIGTKEEVVSRALNDLNTSKVSSTSVTTIWRGTQAEYDAITTPDASTLYIIINN